MNARQGFIGQPVKRKEDQRFLTGRGQYTDDLRLEGQTYAVFVRSPYAHATIGAIDSAAAMKAPGVLGFFTGADFREVGGLHPRCPALSPSSSMRSTASASAG